MREIKLIGDIESLSAGIMELSYDLEFVLSNSGINVYVTQKEESDLRVDYKNNEAYIIYAKKIHFFRGLSLLMQHLQNENEFHLCEKPQFDMNGPMFDVSQGNAVIKVPEIKKTIRQMAQMGLNTLMLYCEDSFDVKEQPYFGYMRSRYKEEEMRECDDYADMFGIEMIPCIQTLAHFWDVLKWHVFDDIYENECCLLVDEEKTYQFLHDLISSASRPFRSKRIHIGMDEAYGLGRGKFFEKHGYVKPEEIMKIHLNHVLKITNELGLEPMMWSDMFFSGINYREIGDFDAISKEISKRVEYFPKGIQLVYWDYYHNEEEFYNGSIGVHRLFGEPVFAGGIWTWIGYGPHWQRTFKNAEAALNTCKNMGIKEVFATIWTDNGCECLYNTNVLGLALYAEHGYNEVIDYSRLKERFEFITKANYDDFMLLEKLDHTPGIDDMETTSYNPSKFLMWQDIMSGLCDKNIEGLPLNQHYEKLASRLKETIDRNGDYNSMFEMNYLVARTLALKSEMGLRVTKAYKENDKELLRKIANEELPELMNRMTKLRACHRNNWYKFYKTLGWDVMDMRYGSLLARMDSAITQINMYINGEMEHLEELEEERQYYDGKPGMIDYLNWFGRIVSASRIAPYC